ncbi:hypothetical protein FHY04_004161 [Sphingomonas sp. BK481]|nr:hypothetical protein [Sphingomonas sp. T1]MBB3589264.1 hypothetical protein [Sphingomonas sp. BK481]
MAGVLGMVRRFRRIDRHAAHRVRCLGRVAGHLGSRTAATHFAGLLDWH